MTRLIKNNILNLNLESDSTLETEVTTLKQFSINDNGKRAQFSELGTSKSDVMRQANNSMFETYLFTKCSRDHNFQDLAYSSKKYFVYYNSLFLDFFLHVKTLDSILPFCISVLFWFPKYRIVEYRKQSIVSELLPPDSYILKKYHLKFLPRDSVCLTLLQSVVVISKVH